MFLYQYIIFIFLIGALPFVANAKKPSNTYSKNNVTIIKVQKNKHKVNLKNKTITKTKIVTKNGQKVTIIKVTPANNHHHKIKKAKRKVKRAYRKHHSKKNHNQGQHSKPHHKNKGGHKHNKKQTTIIIIKPNSNHHKKPLKPNPESHGFQPIKVIPPKVFIIPPKIINPNNNVPDNPNKKKDIKERYEDSKKKGFSYDLSGGFGKNSYSNNYSLSTTIAYKFSKSYYSGLSFYNYNYQEDYSKSAGKTSIMVEPESNEVLATNSFVLAWYNGYKVSKNIILFSQFGIPLGGSNNSYNSSISGYNHYGNWVEGNVSGVESFNGIFTMDLGAKYYLVKGFYISSQYRLFVADINTVEDITESNGNSYARNLKEGSYNISSFLISFGYTFNAK